MHQFEIILALLVAVVLVGIAARRLGVPSPVLLVVAGLVMAWLRARPRVAFEPTLIFFVFIPPLLYRAALTASWRDLRANLRPISLLAVGLVVFTTIVVGVAAHTVVPGLPWAAAFALGALVSPPDAPAATAFLRQLVVPRRIATILEGESLVNDATAIVAYRMAVAAAVSGSFSVAAAGLRFVWVGTAGVAVGLGAAGLIAWLRRHIHAPQIQATISPLPPFAAFLPAGALGGARGFAGGPRGLYLRPLGPRMVAPRGGDRVGGPAGRGVAGAGAGAAVHDGRGRAVPGTRHHHLPHVHGDPGDARPGILAPAARQLAGDLRHR